jgi:hypothetical protein
MLEVVRDTFWRISGGFSAVFWEWPAASSPRMTKQEI